MICYLMLSQVFHQDAGMTTVVELGDALLTNLTDTLTLIHELRNTQKCDFSSVFYARNVIFCLYLQPKM